jgi:flagellar L-ring protein precursor FlgH
MFSTLKRPLMLIIATATLSACGTLDSLKNIGKAPDLAPIGDVKIADREQSLGLLKPPSYSSGPKSQANSLWRTGARAFFKDQRASDVGDIVTVMINITDAASVDNTTTRSRQSAESASMPSLFGLESKLSKVLPNAVDPSSLIDMGSTTSTTGAGSVDRSETINMTIAALVSKVLPNGNLIIQGRQEVRVNFEVRELLITGIIRPADISSGNTILHTQIAEARISYGGRGQLTQLQQARWGQQLYEILFPF